MPFVKRQKNDMADAEPSCEVAQRPTMQFVQGKSADAQGRSAERWWTTERQLLYRGLGQGAQSIVYRREGNDSDEIESAVLCRLGFLVVLSV
jgi:hypothetical protein